MQLDELAERSAQLIGEREVRVRSYLEHAVIQCPLSRTTVYPLALLDHTCEPRRIPIRSATA